MKTGARDDQHRVGPRQWDEPCVARWTLPSVQRSRTGTPRDLSGVLPVLAGSLADVMDSRDIPRMSLRCPLDVPQCPAVVRPYPGEGVTVTPTRRNSDDRPESTPATRTCRA